MFADDELLGPLVRKAPGRRAPGHVDGTELAVKAILGQQVSVAGSRTIASRLALAHGRPLAAPVGSLTHAFPTAEALAAVDPRELVATLPVYLNALSGRGVHVVTVNDYLAKRDSEWMGKLYSFLGLSVGVIVHDLDDEERRAAYAADVTYGTNNEFGFDYLRDNMKFDLRDCVQRVHNFGIVDEVDSILIDEARTPLIISGASEESTDKYYKVNRIIPKLEKGEEIDTQPGEPKIYTKDFVVDEKHRNITVTDEGWEKVEKLLGIGNVADPENWALKHHVETAVKAHALYKKDVEYVVKDGEVIIVDEFTGRLMPGRRWSDGLHQAIEAKENVKIERENQTLATITFQNYFRMYKKLAGHDGHGGNRGAGIRKDLPAGSGRDPDQPHAAANREPRHRLSHRKRKILCGGG